MAGAFRFPKWSPANSNKPNGVSHSKISKAEVVKLFTSLTDVDLCFDDTELSTQGNDKHIMTP